MIKNLFYLIFLSIVSMPAISQSICEDHLEKVIVFQSVEAPQIEPMKDFLQYPEGFNELKKLKDGHQKTIKALAHNIRHLENLRFVPGGYMIHQDYSEYNPYDNYDLVRKKEAYVQIHFNKNSNHKGRIEAYIKIGHQEERPFLIAPVTEENNILNPEGDIYEDNLIPLPMFEDYTNGIGTIKVRIDFIPENQNSCINTKKFTAKIWDTDPIDIKFIEVTNKDSKTNKTCSGYGNVQLATLRKIKNKKIPFEEEMQLIKNAFPINPNHLSTSFIKDSVYGHCDKKKYPLTYTSYGVLQLLNEISKKRIQEGYSESRIIAVTSNNYLKYLSDKESIGIVFRKVAFPSLACTNFKSKKCVPVFFKWIKNGGHTAIILESALSQKTGIITHELGHTYGQAKDFYQSHAVEGKLCRDFVHDKWLDCTRYRIKNSLINKKIKNYFKSIMHSSFVYTFDKKWIDRDTYQKSFISLLSKVSLRYGELVYNEDNYFQYFPFEGVEETKKESVVIVSGIYLPKERKFHNQLKIELTRGFYNPSFPDDTKILSEYGNLEILIQDQKGIVHRTVQTDHPEIKLLKKDGTEEHAELDAIPISFSFPTDKIHSLNNLKLTINRIEKRNNELVRSKEIETDLSL